MTEAPDRDRADLRYLVYHSIGGNWLTRPLDDPPLRLGPDFDRAATRMRESLTQLLQVMANQLDPMLNCVGRSEFLRTGQPRTKAAQGAVALFQPWMKNIVEAASPWVRLVFATPDAVADYATWSKAPYLTADEAFLSRPTGNTSSTCPSPPSLWPRPGRMRCAGFSRFPAVRGTTMPARRTGRWWSRPRLTKRPTTSTTLAFRSIVQFTRNIALRGALDRRVVM